MIRRYDSILAFRADYIKYHGNKSQVNSFANDSWFNNESEAETLRKTELGDTSLVPQAEVQLSQLEQQIETPRKVWNRGVAGAYCSVPDYLAGLPTPMRQLQYQQDETAPITIFADTGSSAAISAETLQKRGITILALVMALIRIRPVELYQLDVGSGPKDGTGESVFFAKINTHPLDLATACYVLTSAGYARRIVYGLEEKLNGHSGGWPDEHKTGFSFYNPIPYYDKLKLRLGLDPAKSLIIPCARMGDELLKQPLVWLQKQISHFTHQQEMEQYNA